MKFHVVAVDATRNVVALDLPAATAAIAIDTAKKRGLTVLSVRPRALAMRRFRGEPAFPLALQLGHASRKTWLRLCHRAFLSVPARGPVSGPPTLLRFPT